jgi:hypothetical protein
MDFKMDMESTRYTLEKHIADKARLVKGSDEQVYARFQSVNGVEIVPVHSEQFERWLTGHCIESCLPVNKQAIKLAIEASLARSWPDLERLAVRVGANTPDEVIYWDLADKACSAVQVTPSGWTIIKDPKVLFRTDQGRQAFTVVESGTAIRNLRDMFGLSDHNEALVISFCLACLRGSGPYPVLLIIGPDDSGRTALAKYIHAVIDASTPDLRSFPSSEKDMMISAKDNHLLVYDDVQTVSPAMGAAICKLSKGTVFSECRRGREQLLFQGARPLILVGNDEMLLNRELASRALVVRLAARKTFTSGFEPEHESLAQMRGALLDIVSHGLRRWPKVEIAKPFRDYEFEKWIAACELHHWGLKDFDAAYENNVSEGAIDLVELDPLLIAFRDYMGKVGTFLGTATRLLQELNAHTSMKGIRWPTSARALSGRLRRDCKLLLPEIEIDFDPPAGRKNERLLFAEAKFSRSTSEALKETESKCAEKPAGTRRKAKKAGPDLPLFAGA